MASTGESGITFDENYRIRVLDTDKYESTKEMQGQTEAFVNRISELSDVVKKYMELIDQQAERIEMEKLRAVGMRNKVATMEEERKRKEKDLKALTAEKQEELERLNIEYESLVKAKNEQELLIGKLSSSSVE
uniref:Intraflagellar transport protein 20 n=1 Tax=Tetraselmis chuii TaxID=63592 RepID=A0A7S1X5G1_9CHLO|mmetsp:Transcript_34216/g.61095  ORF Transcript_34216/g.61095 Transcript_34216/m.61095 type:complete len:133 (+) Transcript_34216:291-689(+)